MTSMFRPPDGSREPGDDDDRGQDEPVPDEDIQRIRAQELRSRTPIASSARDERRDHPDRPAVRRSASTPASPRQKPRASNRAAPAVIGVAIRNENRAADARSRPARRAAEMEMPEREMPGTRASAWAAPIPTAIRERDIGDPLVTPAAAVGQPQDPTAHDQHDGDQADFTKRRGDQVFEEQPGKRGRDRGGYEQPGQAPVGISLERAIADGREPRRHEPEPVAPGNRRAGRPASRCGASR